MDRATPCRDSMGASSAGCLRDTRRVRIHMSPTPYKHAHAISTQRMPHPHRSPRYILVSMAKIIYVKRAKKPGTQSHKPKPATTADTTQESEATTISSKTQSDSPVVCTAIVELGGFHNQALVWRNGRWDNLFRWKAGPSDMGGANATPTITVVRRLDGGLDMYHGYEAIYKRNKDPSARETFTLLKFVFVREGLNDTIKSALQDREEKATRLKTTLREVAFAFFGHLMSEVVGQGMDVKMTYVNITESWSSPDIQALMKCFQSLRTESGFELVNECFRSLIGRPGRNNRVVVDYGHSTRVG
jgi:hypothetical protein